MQPMTSMRALMLGICIRFAKRKMSFCPHIIGIVLAGIALYTPVLSAEERFVGDTVLVSPFGWESAGAAQQRMEDVVHFGIDEFVSRDEEGRVWIVAPVAGEVTIAKNRVILTGTGMRIVFPRAINRATGLLRVDEGQITDIEIDGDVMAWVLLLLPDGVIGLDHDDYGYRIRHEVRNVVDVHAVADGYVSTAPEPLSTENWKLMMQSFSQFFVDYSGISESFFQNNQVVAGQVIGQSDMSHSQYADIQFSTVEDPQPRLGFIRLHVTTN